MAHLGDFMKYLFSFLLSICLSAQIPVIEGNKLMPTIGPSIQYGPGWTNALKNLLSFKNINGKRIFFIMTVVAPSGDCDIKDTMNDQSGWKCYQFDAPVNQNITFKLDTKYKASFRLYVVNRWGDLEEGMLQNTIYRGEPTASYTNPKDSVNKIYLIIDSLDMYGEPYTLEVRYSTKQ